MRELSERFGLQVDPAAKVSTLSVGLRQRVEVLKALSHDTRLLILDEPTAVLTPGEIDDLFVVVRDLARKGCAVAVHLAQAARGAVDRRRGHGDPGRSHHRHPARRRG